MLPRFAPGQFIHLTLESYDRSSFWPESRIFSVANAVADRRTLQLTVSRHGVYSGRILDELREGSVVWGKGPYGEFRIDGGEAVQHAVLIAGGTGVTPFGAFMDSALAEGKLPLERVTLHYGARAPDLLIYREIADACAQKIAGFEVRYYVEQHAGVSGGGETLGSLNIDTILSATVNPHVSAFYLSGPKPMIDSFHLRLNERGVPDERVLIDAWD